VTVSADTLKQATLLGLGLITGLGHTPQAIAVLATDDYDTRIGLGLDSAEALSAGEAAAELGMSRQAILKRIDTGTLRATKTGAGWMISRAAIEEAKRRGRRRAKASTAGR
jgi:excisionase family DNA binding protein